MSLPSENDGSPIAANQGMQMQPAPSDEPDCRAEPEGSRLRRLGIDTGDEHVVFMQSDSPICRSEGFIAHTRVELRIADRRLVAMLEVVHGDLLATDEAGLSESAWLALLPKPQERAYFSHAPTVESLALVRRKIYGHELDDGQFQAIVGDIAGRRYSGIELAAFIAASANGHLSEQEVGHLTRAMVATGSRLHWPGAVIMDKHCVGGLPGNRTTPIVVSIATALGLVMPKTSSRAITSPAGTADTMEMLAPVDLSIDAMRRVVERTGGCIIWGGSVNFSPADDVLIRIERALDVDGEGQLVASILSKKIAAGSTHVVIDIPVGPTAKVRTRQQADSLSALIQRVGTSLGLHVRSIRSDGLAPVGRGIGPALEAHDVMAVLARDAAAPVDLRERSLQLAAHVIELAGLETSPADALTTARRVLDSGEAYNQFLAICEAQGGLRTPGVAAFGHPVPSAIEGRVIGIDNRRLAQAAKLAGAPRAPLAGLTLDATVGNHVAKHQPLFTLHAQTRGELAYALEFVSRHPDIVEVGPP